jgi:hypothetical protein
MLFGMIILPTATTRKIMAETRAIIEPVPVSISEER